MNAPIRKRLGEAWLYRWEAPTSVEIEIDQVHREGDAWHSWIEVRTNAPGTDAYLVATSLNLAAHTSRNSLAKTLALRAPDVNWSACLEMACVLTIKSERIGEPFVKVGSMPAEVESAWTIEPLIRRNQPTLIFGDGSTGKSTTAAYIAGLIAGNVDACGFTPHVTGPVMWLDYEWDRGELDDTVKGIRRGLGVDFPDFDYRRESLPLSQTYRQIRRVIDETGVVLVVIDSIGAALGDDPEKAAPVLRFFNAVRALGVASLCIDHVKHGDAGGRPFGSNYKFHSARMVFEMRKHESPGDAAIHLGVFARKANKGRLAMPFGLAVTFEDGVIDFTREEVKAPSLVAGLPASQQIKLALKEGRRAMTMAEIVDVTGLKEPIARARTNDMVKQRVVVVVPIASAANKYALASSREEGE